MRRQTPPTHGCQHKYEEHGLCAITPFIAPFLLHESCPTEDVINQHRREINGT